MTVQYELDELSAAVFYTPRGDVLEIGSAEGRTTVILSQCAEKVNKWVYSVDPYPEELEDNATLYIKGVCLRRKTMFKENMEAFGCKNVTQFNEYLNDCLHKIPDLSVVFIDGLHEFEIAKEELLAVYPKVVEWGRVYLHDISWNIGQLSKTSEGGLCHLKDFIGTLKWKKIFELPNMLCGVK